TVPVVLMVEASTTERRRYSRHRHQFSLLRNLGPDPLPVVRHFRAPRAGDGVDEQQTAAVGAVRGGRFWMRERGAGVDHLDADRCVGERQGEVESTAAG